ncbi:hypothetical protein BSKO_12914 [Bryopsis sp. KO-2023]|nr:hypothetical protein BSKO_12914 [Bryopsis sp. KO-2023]
MLNDQTQPLLADEEAAVREETDDAASHTPPALEDPDAHRFLYMGVWVCMFAFNFVLARVLARADLPYDAIEPLDQFALYDSLTRMMLFAVVLGWFVRINQEDRFFWLFHWKRWYFFVLFFGVVPFYSWLSNFEPLKHSTEDIHNWSSAMYVAVVGGGLVVLVVIIAHLLLAFRRKNITGAFLYLLARLAVFGYYYFFTIFLSTSHHNDLHLHHYFTAWCCALFAEFNHPISAALLGVMSAIFVQGIGAYTFAPLFNDPGCFSTTLPVTYAKCIFNADANFTLNICPGPMGAIPEAVCTTRKRSMVEFIGNVSNPHVWRPVEPLEMFVNHP